MAMDTNAKIAWDFLKAKGCSDAAAAGILGNIQKESTFNPSAVQPSGAHKGLCQWDAGRWSNLIKYAKSINKSEWNLQVQLEYLWKELKSYDSYFKKQNTNLDSFMKSTDVTWTTVIFEKVFERSSGASVNERIGFAKSWFKKYKGSTSIDTTAKDIISTTPTDTSATPELGTETEEGIQEEFAEDFYKYFKGEYLNISDELSTAMMDSLVKADPFRRIAPLPKEDYIAYGHNYYSSVYNLTLGDSTFVIPPEFITITSSSNSESIVTLRQENTQKLKNGYSKRTIIMDLVFHGIDQINGHQVESPEGWYYVDGLRQLLAQFKCTPFLPIENHTINSTYNIHTVALQSVVCSTVEGFPDMITANIVLQEVDLYPYIESHTMFFRDFIDWDLFRYYYQRQLTESHEYGKLQSIPKNKSLNEFKISILDESVFNTSVDYDVDDVSFYDIIFDNKIFRTVFDDNGKEIPAESNWITYLNSKSSSVHISTFQCGYSNLLTNIQMAENSHPTIQYMGGMDTNFNIVFETNDENVVTALEECNILNNTLIRNHRDVTGIGFIKLESELVELCGGKYVIIDNVVTSTIPGLPGLYNVQISCVAFDVYQKQKEGIHGMNPFKDDDVGDITDAIEQSPDGLINKANQDSIVESKIRERTELYPDLKLPTYKELDEFILKIMAFRNSHTNINGKPLSSYPLTNGKYPKTPQCMLHGVRYADNIQLDESGFVSNINDVIEAANNYDIYVDPDFYVFYPEKYKEMLDSTAEERDKAGVGYSTEDHKPNPTTENITVSNLGSDVTTDSDISGFDYETDAAGATELQSKFIALARKKIGTTYSNANRMGPNSYDCSGLISKCLIEMGIISSSFSTAMVENLIKSGVLKQKYKVSSVKETAKLLAHAVPGDLLHVYREERSGNLSYGHIAIYVGNNKMVHASSSKNQVCEMTVYDGFIRVLQVTKLAKGAKASAANQKVTTNTKTNIDFILEKGDTGTKVKEVQRLLNKIDKAGLEVDGKYDSLTTEAVKEFQKNNNLSVTGKIDSKTSKAINEKANDGLDKSSSKVTVVSGKDATYITDLELERIARTIAKLQYGKPYSSHIALAQLIYDKLMASKDGNLNHILENKMFKGEYSKSIKRSTAYKAAENVFCKGERAYPYRMKTFLGLSSGNSDYLTLDSKHDRLGTTDGFTFWGNKEKKTYKKKFELITEAEAIDKKTVSDPTVEKETEIKNGVKDMDVKMAEFFGKPVLVKTSEMQKDGGWIVGLMNGKGLTNQETRYKDNYNTAGNILMSSFVNQCEYSGKGRLIKAFPTYLFSIVDDDGNWMDGRKLWSNYYILRSLVDIDVVNYNDNPISTATISVTNSYGNLDTLPKDAYLYSAKKDTDFNVIQRWSYEHFGLLMGFGPKLTADLVEQKNIIYKNMVIKAGCRMHLRMGYGSDPLSLPVVMNGYISDLSVGDITTFVCVSDGVELTNAVISDDPKDFNGIFEDQEVSNIYMDLLVKRQSWLNIVNSTWGEPSKYGIEHFGLYFTEHINPIKTINLNEDPMTGGPVEDIINVGLDGVEVLANTAVTIGEDIATMFKKMGDGFFKYWKTTEYDLVKNIYRSDYSGSLAMYSPTIGIWDGEKNVCFSMYNKTPWDAMQIGAQANPEYIGMPLYHQFDSRMFLGLPYFLAKYRYNVINGELYEEAKTFSQVHFIDSLTDIIDNRMLTTSRGIFTNAIVMYVLGKTPTASPTLYSDKTISFSKQSTKIFDTSLYQNIIGPDKLWEMITVDMAKQNAIKIGTSQLLYNWEKAYQGDIFLLGDGGITPCDYIYLNDRYNELNGVCTARTVSHKLSSNTGFITIMTPGMLGFSTLKNSQAQVIITNIVSVGSAFSYYMTVKKCIKDNSEKMAQWYNVTKLLEKMSYALAAGEGYLILGTLNKLVRNRGIAKDVYKILKAADYVEVGKDAIKFGKNIRTTIAATKFLKWGSKADDAVGVIKASKNIITFGRLALSGGIKTIGAELGTAAAPIIGTLIGFVIGTLIDVLISVVIDYFRWNNCIVLLPLQRKGSPYAPIDDGEKLLLTASSNVSGTTQEEVYKDENDRGTESRVSE